MMSKDITTFCPLCQNKLFFKIDEELVLKSKRFPKAFTFEHCDRSLIIYLDAQFKVRGVDIAFKTENKDVTKTPIDNNDTKYMISKFISKDFVELKPIEERTFYKNNSTHEAHQHLSIPDLLERQLINLIYKNNEISLDSLLKKSSYLEDAMNININSNLIQKSLENYVNENIISKRVLQFREEI